MELLECSVCLKNKTAMKCDLCEQPSCKQCCLYINEDTFQIVDLLPEKMRDKAFCPNCYHEEIALELDELQKVMSRARDVNVFMKIQGTETRNMRRFEKPIKVKNCNGKEESLMKLAYITAEMGYDTIVDVTLTPVKMSTGGAHKKQIWSGVGVPINPKRRK